MDRRLPGARMEYYSTRASLLARLADSSDELAWQEFHRLYAGLISRVAVRHGMQAADVDDVIQNVLMKLAKAMPDFQYDRAKGRFRGFLKTIVMREIIERFRQKSRTPTVSHDEAGFAAESADSDPDNVWEEEWRTYHVRQAMRTIEVEFSEKDRLAFEQYATMGRPPRDVAEFLQVSIDQVYQAKTRILRRLGELVARQIEEEG